MLKSVLGTSNVPNALVRVVSGILAGWLAIYVNRWLSDRFLLMRLWDSFEISYGIDPAIWIPVAISVLTGIVFGIEIGALFRPHSSRVAAIAALVQLVAGFLIGGSKLLIPVIQAVGLLIGALFVERLLSAASYRLNAITKGTGIFVVVMFAILFAVIFYGPYRSKNMAHDFCDTISLGEEFKVVVEKAKSGHMNHTNVNGQPSYEFWIDGVFGNYSSCEVKITNGKVAAKVINNYRASNVD